MITSANIARRKMSMDSTYNLIPVPRGCKSLLFLQCGHVTGSIWEESTLFYVVCPQCLATSSGPLACPIVRQPSNTTTKETL